ncbi:MAG: type II toxin-antitoxin system HicB family antitoxin [Desulfamplus sp.]|nr:type II toxin-antitoxin system HicB family antitoxin [Desulfamplus sp.]
MQIQVTLNKGDDGYIIAHCPSLKSCWSQGKTKQEAIENIKEAILLYLEPDPSYLKHHKYEEILELTI